MTWIAAAVICGYLGAQGAAFFRWPLSISIFGAVASSAVVIAYHHDGYGPPLANKMLSVMLTWLVLQPAAYVVGVGVARARDAWRSRKT